MYIMQKTLYCLLQDQQSMYLLPKVYLLGSWIITAGFILRCWIVQKMSTREGSLLLAFVKCPSLFPDYKKIHNTVL